MRGLPAAAAYTHAGRRRSNQDAVVVRQLSSGDELLAVADGMGGHAAGEVASATALETLVAELERGAELGAAVVAANARVYACSRERSEWQGMGTTLVALLRSGTSYRIANVGDSRAYVIDAAGIRQVTRDHSFLVEAVQAGTLSPAEAAESPWRNALTRAVGTEPAVEVDLFGPFPADPPQVVLLCSDGLYKALPPEIIREYVVATGELATALEALSALAYRRGSDDNISVAGIEWGRLPRRSPAITLPLPIPLLARRAAPPPTGPAAAAPAPPPYRPGPGAARKPAARGRREGWRSWLTGLLIGAALLGGLLWWVLG